MNRDELLALCERFAGRRHGVFAGRLTDAGEPVDPALEIIRSFRHAEISESEKNSLLSLVSDSEEGEDVCGESACIRDPYADERDAESDDDDLG